MCDMLVHEVVKQEADFVDNELDEVQVVLY